MINTYYTNYKLHKQDGEYIVIEINTEHEQTEIFSNLFGNVGLKLNCHSLLTAKTFLAEHCQI